MKLHRCLICIGSNTMPDKNLKLARLMLKRLYPDIIFGREMITEPLYFTANINLFHNQLAIFYSKSDKESIKLTFKSIELRSGRTGQDKLTEIVKLDIDLLMIDDSILKEKDMQREYIREGIKELDIQIRV